MPDESLFDATTFGLFRMVAQGRISAEAAAVEMTRREAERAKRGAIGWTIGGAFLLVCVLARQLW